MGVVDDLRRAREDFERGDLAAALDTWNGAGLDRLSADELVDVADAAFLLGDRVTSLDILQRAYGRHLDDGDPAGAVRCAFYVAMRGGTGGDAALARAWAGRGQRLLETMDHDVTARGYLAFLRMFGHIMGGDHEGARTLADEAEDLGRRHGDPELLALGLCGQGRIALYGGRVPTAMAAFDEAMLSLADPRVSPVTAGFVYCALIEACQEISDFARVAEWTAVLQRWCEQRPGLVAFIGQCSVHRGQLMRQQGAWAAALEEFDLARHRYAEAGSAEAVGLADYETGEVHRLHGDDAAAEAAYQSAGDHGHDPQPGLALLWLAQGRDQAAVAAIRRLLAEAEDPVHRSRVLPAAVDVLVDSGHTDDARPLADELEQVAQTFGSGALLAASAYASGLVELEAGDPGGALPYLRKAGSLWAREQIPYDGARVRVLTARALTALGDTASAQRELEAARRVFGELGAAPAVAAVDRLLTPGSAPDGLTTREVEVLRLVASGRSNAQIAAELVLSEKTVARHLSNIFTKIDVGSRTAAAAYAYERGLA